MKLSTRLALVALTVVLTVTGIFALLIHRTARHDAKVVATDAMRLNSIIYAKRIDDKFVDLEGTLQRLAGSITIATLAQHALRSSSDEDIPNEIERGRTLLANAFFNAMTNEPSYLQMRLLHRQDNWKEVVRINRLGTELRRTAPDELQSKGDEFYMQDLINGTSGGTHYTPVSYNREHGVSDGTPVFRIIRPVYAGRVELIGALIINVDFEQFLRIRRDSRIVEREVAAIDRAGSYMLYIAGKTLPALSYVEDPGFEPFVGAEQIGEHGGTSDVLDLGDRLAVVTTVENSLNSASLGLIVVSSEPKSLMYATLNQRLFQQLAVAAALSLGAALLTFVATRHATRPMNRLIKAVSEGESLLEVELPKLDQRDDEIGTIATKFISLTTALQHDRARLEAIHNNVADSIIMITDKGLMADINPAASEMFGYQPDEMIGQPLTMLMPQNMAKEHQGHVARSTISFETRMMGRNREIIGMTKQGTEVPLEIKVSRAVLDGQVHFIGSARSIFERKEAERRQLELLAALERSNTELDRFAYVASHDLKAPLRAISNASNWLAEDLEHVLTDDTRDSLGILRSRAARMERLLDDLLEHSRIGRTRHAQEAISGAALRAELTELINLPPGMSLQVDPRFEQGTFPVMPLKIVLLNLLSNAIKHHHDPSHGHISLEMLEADAFWEFVVMDDGPGIAEAYHTKIFEIFQTLQPRDEVESSGMGLAIIRKHMAVVGGDVRVVSDGTRGTAFHVIWPKQPDGKAGDTAEGMAA
ncbi:PAS domain S-box protein [Vannielia sp.]|uniref:sensor histidine kinase n=1 Tax=Vannielia sp. TaxID=2813045 RepID=UPI00262F0191|nr:PAS domain S-box protein [Vannielia sp.]MDF1872391.1 PAS domain S-box protein [Vannielia sp.]